VDAIVVEDHPIMVSLLVRHCERIWRKFVKYVGDGEASSRRRLRVKWMSMVKIRLCTATKRMDDGEGVCVSDGRLMCDSRSALGLQSAEIGMVEVKAN